MAIQDELQYGSEADFTTKYVMPLLRRRGYAVVAYYHGSDEFGKDVVFGEIDKLGHVRYCAAQIKAVSSIGLSAVAELIQDCEQAFANPFKHPQTGAEEKISAFYAINSGTFSSQARTHFYSQLRHRYGANVRMLQGEDLLAIDRATTAESLSVLSARVSGLIAEVNYNNWILRNATLDIEKQGVQDKKQSGIVIVRVKRDVTAACLGSPQPSSDDLTTALMDYHRSLAIVDSVVHFKWRGEPAWKSVSQNLVKMRDAVASKGFTLIQAANEYLKRLDTLRI
ncbi:restriction endonuclease [Botrimarina mediterranea]|uniref:Restriction endonuclease type IV Mrr domain-containing protein n=1 Tax=Botrimarina mediterranea TaxID=2528022 RepID=A0A518K8P5_9BACT|nr:restriction endonuclease [Botrimarina mediterranea]QDV74164.1 hypothetical protein Spa11_23640 [Botrimarina mediterranea]QDV78795.1 hypothetical protein K2D_24030 [Planctomycetes bacterium K2D]